MVEENFFSQSERLFKLLHVWHDRDNKTLRLCKITMLLFFGVGLFIMSLWKAVEDVRRGDISTALNEAMYILPIIACTQKIGSAAFSQDEVYGCIKQMEQLSARFKNISDVEKCLSLYKRMFSLGIYITLICGLSFSMYKLTTEVYRPLPFTPHFFNLNVTKTPNWQLLYVYEVFTGLLLTISAIAYDTLFCGMMCVSSGILASLSQEIKEFDNIIEDEQTLDAKMKEVIDKLNEITQLTSRVSSTFSITILIHIIYNCNVLTFGLFMMSVLPFGLEFFSMVMVIVLGTFQLWIYCYFGQIVVSQREVLQRELYFTRWYDASKNFETMLLLTIFESQNDRYIYAGKVIPLSLETFTQVVKKAYALFTFFNEFR